MKKSQKPAVQGQRAEVSSQGTIENPELKSPQPLGGKTMVAIGVLLLISFAGAGYLLGREITKGHCPPRNLAAPDKVTLAHPGPWGNLEYVPITIAAPEEFLGVKTVEHTVVHWVFPGFTAATFADFLSKLDLTPRQREQLLSPSVMKQGTDGIDLFPPADLCLSISPKGRQQLCEQLARFLEKNPGLEVIPAKTFNEHLANSGVSESSLALVRKFACSSRGCVIFPDMPYVVAAIPNYKEQFNFIRAITRQETLLVKLHVTPDSDINELANYYGKACWAKDVVPMLESLSHVPGGARIDLVHLLPPLPTELLYTFPMPNGPYSTNATPDCHWTSFNFFLDKPDSRYADTTFIASKLKSDYYIVPSDPRYGDIVMFCKPDGSGIHSAVYLFDNVVFTKNGASVLQPWKLATIDELLDGYSFQTTPDKPLQVVYYRNKYF